MNENNLLENTNQFLSDMPTNSKKTETPTIFGRTNYMVILLACMTIVMGLVLMAGNGTTNTAFETDIFSIRRIVIAPLVCLTGYIGIIVGILWKPSAS